MEDKPGFEKKDALTFSHKGSGGAHDEIKQKADHPDSQIPVVDYGSAVNAVMAFLILEYDKLTQEPGKNLTKQTQAITDELERLIPYKMVWQSNIKQQLEQHHNEPFLSKLEFITLLQMDSVFQIMDKLKTLKDVEAIDYYMRDLRETLSLGNLCKQLVATQSDTLLLSMGSFGVDAAEMQQQRPNFVLKLDGKTEVLNWDPAFQQEGVDEKLSTKDCKVYDFQTCTYDKSAYRGAEFESFHPLKKNKIIFQEIMEKHLEELLANTVTKIILFYHVGASLPELFCDLVKKYPEKMGKQLEVITDYLAIANQKNPCVFIFSDNLAKLNVATMISQVRKISRDVFQSNILPETTETKPETSIVRSIYSSTADIPAGALFPKIEDASSTPKIK